MKHLIAMAILRTETIGEKFHVWSFWDKEYLGIQQNNLEFKSLPPHSCKLLRLTPIVKDGFPVLIGSDLHIAMGSAEIKNSISNSKGITIELNGNAGARDGKLYIYNDKPLVLKYVSGCTAKIDKIEDHIQIIALTSRMRTENQQIVLVGKVTALQE